MIEFNRVLSPLLDDNKYWYTLNPDLCDTVPRTFASYNVFKVFDNDIKQVNIKDGSQVPAKWFSSSVTNPSKIKADKYDVYVASTFGILAGVLASCKEGKTHILPALNGVITTLHERRLDDHADGDGNGDTTCNGESSTTGSAQNTNTQVKSEHKRSKSSARHRLFKSPPFRGTKSPPSCPTSTSPLANPVSPFADSIEEIRNNANLTPAVKKRKIRKKAKVVIEEVKNVCSSHSETLADALSECCLSDSKGCSFARETISNGFDQVVERKGVKRAFSDLLSEETTEMQLAAQSVPNWQNLLLKLETRTSDKSWQTIINRTNLGRNKVIIFYVSQYIFK